jgi:prophage regulatory protein
MSERILRLPEVISRTGLSKSTLYDLLETGRSDFPKPIKILGARAVGFVESEVEAWVQCRISESRR